MAGATLWRGTPAPRIDLATSKDPSIEHKIKQSHRHEADHAYNENTGKTSQQHCSGLGCGEGEGQQSATTDPTRERQPGNNQWTKNGKPPNSPPENRDLRQQIAPEGGILRNDHVAEP